MPDQVGASGNQLLYIGKAQRERGTHEQLRRTRVESVIDACRVLTGDELQRHGNRREKRQGGNADHERLSFMRELCQAQEHERPDDEKLHAYAQIPQVGEGRGETCGIKIGDLTKDIRPVAYKQRRGQRIGLQLGQQTGACNVDRKGRERDCRKHGRHKPAQTFCQIAPVIKRAGILELAHHAPGGKVACEYKEQGNAQKAAGEQRWTRVVKDDADDGERAQAIERKDSRRRGSCLFRMGPSICLLGSPGGKALDVFFAKSPGSQFLLFRQFGTTRFRRHVHPSPLSS